MKDLTIIINNSTGLHHTAAVAFIQTTNRFDCSISIEKADRKTDAKSLLGVLSLDISNDNTIKLTAKGHDETSAIETLERFFKLDLSDKSQIDAWLKDFTC